MRLYVYMVVGGSICTLLYILFNKALPNELSLKWKNIFLKINIMFYLLPVPWIMAEIKGKVKVWLGKAGVNFPEKIVQIDVLNFDSVWKSMIIKNENGRIEYITGYQKWLPVLVAAGIIFSLLLIGWFAAYLIICHICKKDIFYLDSEDYLKDQKTGRRKIQIGVSSYVSSPVTIGVIRPIILLPANGRKYFDTKGVISHEVKHIRKMDGMFRLLSFIIVAMEWYNPLAHYLFRENVAVSEIICDEAAVKDMSKAEKMNYMECIIESVAKDQNKKLVTMTLGTSKSLTEERMKRIMGKNQKKIWKKGMAIGIMAFCFLISSIPALAYMEPRTFTIKGNCDPIDWEVAGIWVSALGDSGEVLGDEWRNPDWGVDFSQGDQLFIGENGEVYPVQDDDGNSNSQMRASCTHNYIAGTYQIHRADSNGGCTVITYDGQCCSRCGDLIRGSEISSITYKVCPH